MHTKNVIAAYCFINCANGKTQNEIYTREIKHFCYCNINNYCPIAQLRAICIYAYGYKALSIQAFPQIKSHNTVTVSICHYDNKYL